MHIKYDNKTCMMYHLHRDIYYCLMMRARATRARASCKQGNQAMPLVLTFMKFTNFCQGFLPSPIPRRPRLTMLQHYYYCLCYALIYGYIKFSIKRGKRTNVSHDLGKNCYRPKKLQTANTLI